MIVRPAGILVLAALVAACGSEAETAPDAAPEVAATAAPVQPVALACERVNTYWGDQGLMPLEGRASPYDSTLVTIGDAQAKVCYGRPSVRGREIFGGLIPYDTLWRAGANEPTTIHLPVAAEIAGLAVEPGSYSLYTVPGRDQWTVIVNRATSQWGEETQYTPEIRAQEVGRAPIPSAPTDTTVETFTIRAEPVDENVANLVLEWEDTRATIPIHRR